MQHLSIARSSEVAETLEVPRRPKPRTTKRVVSQAGNGPPTSRRSLRGMKYVGIALSVGTLAGCVPDYQNPIISPKPLEQPGVLTATLDSSQLERILKEISEVVAVADATLDRESLEVRVTGPALEIRRAAYALAAKSTDSLIRSNENTGRSSAIISAWGNRHLAQKYHCRHRRKLLAGFGFAPRWAAR